MFVYEVGIQHSTNKTFPDARLITVLYPSLFYIKGENIFITTLCINFYLTQSRIYLFAMNDFVMLLRDKISDAIKHL